MYLYSKKLSYNIILILIYCFPFSFAQAPDTLWTKTYGGAATDYGNSVQQTSDGGYIITGATASFGAGGVDVWLIKTDSLGDTLWTKTFGDIDGDVGYSVRQTSDGGYIVTGATWSYSTNESDVYLIKTDVNGDSLWTEKYGGIYADKGHSIQQTSDEGYIIVGETASFGAGGCDVWLLKTDSLGDTLWTRTYGGNGGEIGYSIQLITDGGYIITGSTNSFGTGKSDVYLIKTDSIGDTLWTKVYGGSDYDVGNSVNHTIDKGFIITGYTYSFGAGHRDVYLIKTDSLGDTVWTRTYGGFVADVGNSVQQTSDGGYIIAGTTFSFYPNEIAIYLIKTDTNGDSLWTKISGGPWDEGNEVQQTNDGGYIVVGMTYPFGGNSDDVYLIKTAPDVGIEEENEIPRKHNYGVTIINGPFLLPEDKTCRIFDIAGRNVTPEKMKPGIYFIEIDGLVTQKIIKVK